MVGVSVIVGVQVIVGVAVNVMVGVGVDVAVTVVVAVSVAVALGGGVAVAKNGMEPENPQAVCIPSDRRAAVIMALRRAPALLPGTFGT
jgi:hypothetical protein